jgi:hypothetical protein
LSESKNKWVKGMVSPNPSGRPAVVGELRDLARRHTNDALNALIDVCNNKAFPPAARVTAACALLDRGYGRPMQSVENKVEIQSMADTAAQVLMELSRKAKEAKRLDAEEQMIDVTP